MSKSSLYTASDQEIKDALADANIPTLLVCMAQICGDLSLLSGEELPSTSIDGVSRMSAERQEEIRSQAFDIIRELRDGTRQISSLPPQETLQHMASVYLGQSVAPEYIPMMLSEMAFEGTALDKIKWSTPPSPSSIDDFKVTIIGAGVSGICIAIHLQKAGIPFVIIEKNPTVGGTWYENTYPGCGVDTPNHFYSYSFEPKHDWPAFYSKRDEIYGYLESMADKYDVRKHIRFETELISSRYLEEEKCWESTIRTSGKDYETFRSNVLISAVGQLNQPKIPDFPGKDSFQGPSFHTARWEPEHDLTGKTVAMIGTGASAMQIAPSIAPSLKHLTIFQRSPHWIRMLPDYHRNVAPGKEWLLRNVPFYNNWYRFRLFWSYGDFVWRSLHRDPHWPHADRSLNSENEHHRNVYIRSLTEALNGNEELLAKVVPDYPPFAKRMLIDNHWCEMLQQENVTLLTSGVSQITSDGVVDDDGGLHECEAIIYATGFKAHDFLSPIEIIGRNGQDLSEMWGDDPKAYLGVAVPNFPNMFMLYGPNTNLAHGGSIIFNSECQSRYITQCIMRMIEHGDREVEVRADVSDAYSRKVDEAHDNMVWTHPGVNNWYTNSAGRVVSNSPWRLIDYWEMTRNVEMADFNCSK